MKGPASFPRQLAQASLVVFLLVAGLYWLGQRSKDAPPAPVAHDDERKSSGTKEHASLLRERPARALAPSHAWLVADFRGDLLQNAPFADAKKEDDPCRFVPAPDRVSIALLPPKRDTSPEMVLASPHVSDAFWKCAKMRVLAAGGKKAGRTEHLSVLESPSGVLARGPGGALSFTTSTAHSEVALALLLGREDLSATQGPHALLSERLPQKMDPVLRVTVQLPEGWPSLVGPEGDRSPLRHLRAAGLAADQDGNARGVLYCTEPGCDELLQFAQRAREDMLQELPSGAAARVDEALTLEKGPKKGDTAGHIQLSWDGEATPLFSLLGRFLPAASLLGNDDP